MLRILYPRIQVEKNRCVQDRIKHENTRKFSDKIHRSNDLPLSLDLAMDYDVLTADVSQPSFTRVPFHEGSKHRHEQLFEA